MGVQIFLSTLVDFTGVACLQPWSCSVMVVTLTAETMPGRHPTSRTVENRRPRADAAEPKSSR